MGKEATQQAQADLNLTTPSDPTQPPDPPFGTRMGPNLRDVRFGYEQGPDEDPTFETEEQIDDAIDKTLDGFLSEVPGEGDEEPNHDQHQQEPQDGESEESEQQKEQGQEETEGQEDGQEQDLGEWDYDFTKKPLKVNGEVLPMPNVRLSGPDAEAAVTLMQRGMSADVRYAEAAELREQLGPARELIRLLATNKQFAKHVASFDLEKNMPTATGQGVDTTALPEGEYDQEFAAEVLHIPEAVLQKHPVIGKLMEQNQALQQVFESIAPVIQDQKLQVDWNKARNLAAETMESETAAQEFDSYRDLISQRLVEMNAKDPAKARAMDNPKGWVSLFMFLKARGISPGQVQAKATSASRVKPLVAPVRDKATSRKPSPDSRKSNQDKLDQAIAAGNEDALDNLLAQAVLG